MLCALRHSGNENKKVRLSPQLTKINHPPVLAHNNHFQSTTSDLDEIEEVNANCILMVNLQHASTSGTQLDKAPVYDTDGSAVNDNHVNSVATSMVQSGGTVETSSAPNEETRAHQETVYLNLIDQVAQVNCNMRATNAKLKSELARYKIQEYRIKISQEKYDKLKKCYQKSVYQEQCLTKKINALHLSFAKQITTLNDKISNLDKQLSKEKSYISSLMEEKKKLKHDFKTREDKFLDKKVDLEARIKDLENILHKRDQTVQTIHMLNPKPDLFYHPNQKMTLGYLNLSYLKKAQLKQQSLYNGNLLLEEHDPPAVYDSEETLKLAQESREKMRFLKKEIKHANYAKINHLSAVFVPQTTKSKEELFLSNVLNMVTVSKMISIPNEDLLDDTTPSVARKFLNEEADESLDKQKYLEFKIERLLKASVSHDIMSIVQNGFVDVPSDLRTELDQCKYDKISYYKAYNDMQQKVKRLQAQLRDLKGKSSDTHSASNTLDLLNQKLESKIVELEFQVLRARVFENTFESMKNTSGMSVNPHVDKPKLSAVTPLSKKLHASMPSHSIPQPREFNVVKHRNVIALGMFKINLSQMPRENVSSDTVAASSTRSEHTARTGRPQPKGNTRNARVPSVSKSSEVKKNVTVKDHRRTLLLSKNQKTMSSECNNIKLAIRNDKSEIICDTYKQCLVTANHDACFPSYVNALNSRANKLCANVPLTVNKKRHRTQVWKPKQVGSKERLACKPRLPKLSLKWSPSGCSFDLKGKLFTAKETNFPNDDKAFTSNPHEPMRKRFPNSTVFLGRLSKFVYGASTRVVPSI
nr:hypothetical protein [Tanacetum cinerariifolium]